MRGDTCAYCVDCWSTFQSIHMYARLFCCPCDVGTGLVVTGEGVEVVGFVQRHPTVLFNIIVFGITSAVGQVGVTAILRNLHPHYSHNNS